MKKILIFLTIMFSFSICYAEDLLINDKVYVESTSIKVYTKNKVAPDKEAEVCILFSTTTEIGNSKKTIHYVFDVQKNTYKSIEFFEYQEPFKNKNSTSMKLVKEDAYWLMIEDNPKVSYMYVIALQYIATHHHIIVEQSKVPPEPSFIKLILGFQKMLAKSNEE